MTDESKGTIQIDSTIEARAGVHSNLVMAMTNGGTTRLDFVATEMPLSSEGDLLAVLVSRIYMDNADLVSLRDMLVRHTANWKIVEEPKDVE